MVVPILSEPYLTNTDVSLFRSAEIQLQRLMKRDRTTREDASSRLSSQLPITDKPPYADHVVENSGTIVELETETQLLINKLTRESGGFSWLICWLIPPIGILFGLKSLVWRQFKRDRKKASKTRGES